MGVGETRFEIGVELKYHPHFKEEIGERFLLTLVYLRKKKQDLQILGGNYVVSYK